MPSTSFSIKALFILMSLLSYQVQADQDKYEYYAMMAGVISPFLEYKPILPIDKKTALQQNHYRVAKDSKGLLKEMAYYEKSKPSNNSYFRTHKVVYQQLAKDDYERRYFDKEGKASFMWRHYYEGGDIHIERYKTEGKLTHVNLFNDKAEAIESGTGSHHLIAKKLSKSSYIQTQFSLDGTASVFRNPLPFMATLISVDGLGQLDKVSNVKPPSQQPIYDPVAGFATMKVQYDDYGVESGWDYLDSEGNLMNQPESLEEAGIARWSYYRKWRNRQQGQFEFMWVQVYDKTGLQAKHPNGATTVQYTKDEQDRYQAVSYLDSSGELFQLKKEGYAKRVFSYDEDGTRSETQFDKNGNLVKE